MGDKRLTVVPRGVIVALPAQTPPTLQALIQGPSQPSLRPRLPPILRNSLAQHLTKAAISFSDVYETEDWFERQERFKFHLKNLERQHQGLCFIPDNYIPGQLPKEQLVQEQRRLYLINRYLQIARKEYIGALEDYNSKLKLWCTKGGNIDQLRTGISLPGRNLRNYKPDLYNGPAGYGLNWRSFEILQVNKENTMIAALEKLASENPIHYEIPAQSLGELGQFYKDPFSGLLSASTPIGNNEFPLVNHPVLRLGLPYNSSDPRTSAKRSWFPGGLGISIIDLNLILSDSSGTGNSHEGCSPATYELSERFQGFDGAQCEELDVDSGDLADQSQNSNITPEPRSSESRQFGTHVNLGSNRRDFTSTLLKRTVLQLQCIAEWANEKEEDYNKSESRGANDTAAYRDSNDDRIENEGNWGREKCIKNKVCNAVKSFNQSGLASLSITKEIEGTETDVSKYARSLPLKRRRCNTQWDLHLDFVDEKIERYPSLW